jgi:hypothetical protein
MRQATAANTRLAEKEALRLQEYAEMELADVRSVEEARGVDRCKAQETDQEAERRRLEKG